jgi:N-acetylglucosamine kinase-like BadF-type ATPase
MGARRQDTVGAARYLAVDVGGTSTRAVVVGADGSALGYGSAGSGNPTSSGSALAAEAIVAATAGALQRAGVAAGQVADTAIAIAGGDGTIGRQLHAELLEAGLPAGLTFEPDLLAAFHSGTTATAGYVLVAGTGAGAIRIRDDRIDGRCDGLGWLLGDAGSGFWIGHHGVLAAVAELDGRGPPTALTDLVLADLGVQGTTERTAQARATGLRGVVDAVYRLRPVELARLAPVVLHAAAAGDDVAGDIVARAAAELAATLAVVLVDDLDGPLVLSGSILSQPVIGDPVVESYRTQRPGGDVATVSDGLAGAAVLVLRRAGERVDDVVLARIHASLADLRADV